MRSWKRVTLVVLAVASLAAGAGLLLAGLAVVAVFGREGVATSEPGRAFTPSAVIVADPGTLDFVPGRLDLFELVVAARSERGGRTFVGIGPAPDVDRWLTGAARAEVDAIRTRPLRLVQREVPGTASPAPPADQVFWVESDTGFGERTVRWDPRPGAWRVVVATADGSAPLEARVRVDLRSPWAFWVGVALLAAGGLLLLVGLALLVAALRARRRPDLPPGVPGGYPEGYQGRRPPAPAALPAPADTWPPVPPPAPLPWEEDGRADGYGPQPADPNPPRRNHGRSRARSPRP